MKLKHYFQTISHIMNKEQNAECGSNLHSYFRVSYSVMGEVK